LSRYADRKVEQPALFITGEKDMATRMFGRDYEAKMREAVPGLRGLHIIPGAGHWTQQEKPTEVNAILLAWLADLPK
jgi:pimeloyl-ACP methyl ester carboxylesterase